MGNQIYFKIAGYVDLAVLIIFTPRQIFDIINGFWVITQKPAILPCSIFSNSGHVGWCTASPDTIYIETRHPSDDSDKFGFNWSSSFRGEHFWKSLRRRTPSDGNSSPGPLGQVS